MPISFGDVPSRTEIALESIASSLERIAQCLESNNQSSV